jgi:hypothetical protein
MAEHPIEQRGAKRLATQAGADDKCSEEHVPFH